jgi:hopene-associated glycosyltransferase HpnB
VPPLSLLLAAFSLGIWLYLLLARGQFWRLRPFDDDLAPHKPPQSWPPVIAMIPARNEAETIEQTITSLIRQDYPGQFRIFLVDDHSEDATSEKAREIAQQLNAADRLTIRAAAPLPPGWTGKLWALNEGVSTILSGAAKVPTAAASSIPTYLWFTDADIIHPPDTLLRLVSRAEQNHLDLTSLMVLLQAKTLPEQATIPAFLFFFLKLYPPNWLANPEAHTAGAAGGCILLRREALDKMGGLAAIRGEVIDDCALARAVKRRGGKIWMGLTRRSVSLRGYGTFAGPRDMIARTAFTQLHYSAPYLVAVLVGLVLTYIAPIALLFAHNNTTRTVALVTWLLMSLLFLPTVRFYRLSPFWVALLPLTAAFYAYATTLSAVRYYLRRGAQWKGRSQALRP